MHYVLSLYRDVLTECVHTKILTFHLLQLTAYSIYSLAEYFLSLKFVLIWDSSIQHISLIAINSQSHTHLFHIVTFIGTKTAGNGSY